ncbi:hypothetical protein ACSX1A_10160 [Pontibacter sp. MBLB2868]|uniref:hypothetical protein n=1 Tax=Pontibacter sp. MBLB2868 TaxID=3451555 RepID=UPI003F751051
MNRNYQQEHYGYDSFDQMYNDESEESRQRKEYRDLYDPFKSNWNKALGNAGHRVSADHVYGSRSRGYTVSLDKESSGTSTYGNRMHGKQRYQKDVGNKSYGYSPYGDEGFANRPAQGNPISKNRFNEQKGTGYSYESSHQAGAYHSGSQQVRSTSNASKAGNESGQNTYGYYTTGYGPRD